MSTMPYQYQIVTSPGLSEAERARVSALAALCNAEAGLHLKLSLDFPANGADQDVNAFRAYHDGELVGYCGLDGGGERTAEVCGMVHPAHRRHGIGRALLDAVAAEAARRGTRELLVICEDASSDGRAFVTSTGAFHRFSERRMELDLARRPHPASASPGRPNVTLRAVEIGDLPRVAAIRSAAFDDPLEDALAHLERDLPDPNTRYYLASMDGVAAATLKIIRLDGRAYIYAFGVLPEWRRRGVGRETLIRAFELLAAEGFARVALEVETENAPAVALYQAVGFRTITTYGYYAFPAARRTPRPRNPRAGRSVPPTPPATPAGTRSCRCARR
jgi:ribosomal protein S18 acetylase RimI-like enzyme